MVLQGVSYGANTAVVNVSVSIAKYFSDFRIVFFFFFPLDYE